MTKLVLFALLTISTVHAATYEEVCAVDPEYCSRAVDFKKAVVKPNPELIAVAQWKATEISQVADRYGVKREAIIGAIMAENTMNVNGLKTAIKKAIVAADLNGKDKGHSFSLGLGAIRVETAKDVEKLVAKTEGRPERDVNAIQTALNDPKESIIYAAAILRNAQDVYKENGFDISNNIPVQVTLYNLGKVEERAKKAKETGREPRINYFGYFVQENMDVIKETASYKSIDGVPPPNSRFVLKSEKALLPYPPSCDNPLEENMGVSAYGLQREHQRTLTLNVPQATSRGRGNVQVLGQGLDCDMKKWTLVKAENDAVGWIREEQLVESGLVPIYESECTSKRMSTLAANKCAKMINDSVGSEGADGLKEDGFVAVKLASEGNTDNFSYDKWNTSCLVGRAPENAPNSMKMSIQPLNTGGSQAGPPMPMIQGRGVPGYPTAGTAGYGNYSNYGSNKMSGSPWGGQVEEIDNAGLKEMLERADAKKAEIMKTFGVKSEKDLPKDIIVPFFQFESMRDANCKVSSCNVDQGRFAQLLKVDPKELKNSLANAEEFNMSFMGIVMVDERTNPQSLLEFSNKINEKCKPVLEQFPAIKRQWDREYANVVAEPKSATLIVPFSNETIQKCEFITENVINPQSEGKPCLESNLKLSRMGSAVSATMLQNTSDQELFIRNDLFGAIGQMRTYTRFLKGPQVMTAAPAIRERFDETDCKYDPVATVARVNAVLQNKCVETIIVPDPFVVKAMTLKGETRVVQGKVGAGNRFAVNVKGTCLNHAAQ